MTALLYYSISSDLTKDEIIAIDERVAKNREGVNVNPADYDFSQDQAKEINAKGGIVAYVRKGKTLPNLDLIRAYQNAIKNFCEDRTQSDRNDKSTFRGDPSITFFNEKSRQAVIFNRETKVFITAYKISDDQRDRYIESGEIGQ